MDISKFLAKVIGIYLIIVSVVMLSEAHQFISNVNLLVGNPALMFVTGFFTLILGVLMVVGHNIWQWHWRVIVTIIAWLTLFKGIWILAYPQITDQTTAAFNQNITIAYAAAIFDLILGLILTYLGFKR